MRALFLREGTSTLICLFRLTFTRRQGEQRNITKLPIAAIELLTDADSDLFHLQIVLKIRL